MEAEISFKRWKITKEKQLEEEQFKKKLQEEKEREQLIEQKYKRRRKEVLLAYSNLSTCNQKLKKFENRPKTARVRRRKKMPD